MAKVDQSTKQVGIPPEKRKAYVRPTLKEFGPVGVLTQAGTGQPPEMAMGNNAKKML